MRNQDREFLAADAAGQVARADACFQTTGEFAQDRIAHIMAESVVHRFEVIEIGQEEAKGAVAPGRLRHGAFEMRVEEASIVQPGQTVDDGELKGSFDGLS